MKIYVVWFPSLGRFVGKRGMIEESAERAVMFWQFTEAKEWADALGGEVRAYEQGEDGEISKEREDPF